MLLSSLAAPSGLVIFDREGNPWQEERFVLAMQKNLLPDLLS